MRKLPRKIVVDLHELPATHWFVGLRNALREQCET